MSEEQTKKKRTSKKFNWSNAQRVAIDVAVMALTAFVGGLAMSAGQRVAGQITRARNFNEKTGLSIVRDRTAV